MPTTKSDQAHLMVNQTHMGITHASGIPLVDHLRRTVEIIQNHSVLRLSPQPDIIPADTFLDSFKKNSDIVSAAWLHKYTDAKYRVQDKNLDDLHIVRHIFHTGVYNIISELASEPPLNPSLNKTEQWQEKAKWASGLSYAAREILLAEKICNFETICNNPTPKKDPAWHIEYIKTRMVVVDALKQTNPEMYEMARGLAEKGLEMHQKKQQFLNQAKTQYAGTR